MIETEYLFTEGARYLAENRLDEAEQCLRQALQRLPDFPEAHANLALVLDKNGQLVAAEQHYRRAIALCPEQTQTHLNLAVMLAAQKRFAEAEQAYDLALALAPQSPVAWSNLGVLLASMQREAPAELCYRTAMAFDPDYRLAPFNLSYLLLRQGRFAEGWECFEARDWYGVLERHLDCPRWQGQPLAGKRLLIGFEAGHGDMIQFYRYVAQIKAAGAAHIAGLCHPGLTRLFASLPGLDQVFAIDAPFPVTGWDYWTPPLSLPFYFQTRLENIPAQLPYLFAEPALSKHWAEVMGEPADQQPGALPVELKVGLVWQGNPAFENDADRSLPSLACLQELGDVAGVRFFSLQKGSGEAEASAVPAILPLTDLAPGIKDFADTAAIIMNLDLLITVDTAVAHLAGALGKPCWVLLPNYKADWRWLTERSDSPWYPQVMRLFRQQNMGDWSRVLDQVRAELALLVAEKLGN